MQAKPDAHPATHANPPSARQHRALRSGTVPCMAQARRERRTGTQAGRCAQFGWVGLGRTAGTCTADQPAQTREIVQARVRITCGKSGGVLGARAPPPPTVASSPPPAFQETALAQ